MEITRHDISTEKKKTILVLFVQPHLRDPGVHLDPDASHHTGSLSHPASHVAAHAAEGDPAHRHSKLQAALPINAPLVSK